MPEMSDWLEAAETLRQSRTPFVLATVIAREAPQSARVGAHALITADGRIEGWIGGGCIRPTIVREALAALGAGRPRLVRMSPGAPPDERPDVRVYPLTCQGEGAVDVYLEPVLPAPVLVILGTSPVARALAALAPTVGLDPALHDPAVLPAGDAGVGQLAARVKGAGAGPALRYVVVATMGEADEEALEAAVRAEAAYIGLVASRKKAEALFAYLRSRGLSAETMRDVKAPAGLDLGAATPGEIALSVLAELVERRRRPTAEPSAGAAPQPQPRAQAPHASARAKAPEAPPAAQAQTSHAPTAEPAAAQPPAQPTARRSLGGLPIVGGRTALAGADATGPGVSPAAGGAPSPTAVDPVCGMTVDVATARHTLTLPDGRAFYFCCPRCRGAFEREPERFLAPAS